MSYGETFFLCTGLPKSGTTFLQRTLNLHPLVSCPSEHQLLFLRQLLLSAVNDYNNSLALIDQRTGGQGCTPLTTDGFRQVLKQAALAYSREAAQGLKVHGINDNAAFARLGLYERILESPKIIAIIRNPIDRGVSAWVHNHKLREKEANAEHMQFLEGTDGTLEGWMRKSCSQFIAVMETYLRYATGRDNIVTVRYEDLIANKDKVLWQIFAFLGVPTTPDEMTEIVDKSSLNAMKKEASYPGFFGSASRNLGGDRVSPELRAELLQTVGPTLERLGYLIREA